MKTKISIVLGSILGALALHTVLVACGSGSGKTGSGGGGAGSAVGDAAAQTPPTCKAWKTAFVLYPVTVPNGDSISALPLNQIIAETTLPAGWEPIGNDPGYGVGPNQIGVLVTVRQCVSQ